MLRYDQLESVNVEVWPTQIFLLNKILALAIFDGPTQSGFYQLSQKDCGGGGGVFNTPPPSLPRSHPWPQLYDYYLFSSIFDLKISYILNLHFHQSF